MPPEKVVVDLDTTVARLAAALLRLDTGALARLRRMDIEGPGEAAFWKLAVEHGMRTDAAGLRLVRIMALLTPKGDPHQRRPFHSRKRPLGAALCDAGLSEARLARFLALPSAKRGAALESLARFLAAARAPADGIDCADIARLLFFDDVRTARRLAESYYRRFDRQASDQEKEPAA